MCKRKYRMYCFLIMALSLFPIEAVLANGSALIALDCYEEPGLLISGITIVDVNGGDIQVNSGADQAFRTDGSPTIVNTSEINVHGDVWKLPDDVMQYVNTGAPRMPDPLCLDAECDGSVSGTNCLPEPDFGPPIQEETVVIESGETRTLQPGYYPGGLEIVTSTGTGILEPGIYVLDGVGLNINGGNLIGDGVMFYITGTGSVDLRGGGNIQLNQNFEIEFGPFTGIAIYQDRYNYNDAVIIGTNNLDIVGVLYFPQNHVEIGGEGDGFGTQIIADTICIHPAGVVQINYDGRNPFPELTPPIANANGPYIIYVDDILTLDANGSTDDDNDIVSYMWDLDDNGSFETDVGGVAVFDVNYTYLQSLGLLVDNTYNIHLKVTDSEELSDTADSTLTIISQPALEVAVDIKPGSCPNPLNVKSSGVLPVAILGTEEFDVNEIDATSIKLAGISAIRHSCEDLARPVVDSNDCNCTEEGPDGYLDLTLKFKTQEIVNSIGDVDDGDVLALELTGVLSGERPIEGQDCVVVRGKARSLHGADINGDGKVDMADFALFAGSWLQSSIVDD